MVIEKKQYIYNLTYFRTCTKNIFNTFIFFSIGFINATYASDETTPDYISLNRELTPGYVKLLALSSTNDITASSLKDEDGLEYDKISIPYNFDNIYEYQDYTLSLGMRASYLKIKANSINLNSSEKFSPLWEILSAVVAPKVSYKINDRLQLNTEIEFGYNRMENKSTLKGDDLSREEFINFGMLDWTINSISVTPKIGLNYNYFLKNQNEINLNGNIGYMFLSELDDHKSIDINSQVGTWSIESAYIIKNAFDLNNKIIDLRLSNNIGGFYGQDYRALGFGFVNNSSVALEYPVRFYTNERKIRIGIGYLVNDYANGLTFILGIQ